MWFDLTEENKKIQDMAKEAAKRIGYSSFEMEKKGDLALNLKALRILQEYKLLALHIPKKYGGLGGNFIDFCTTQEEVCKYDLGIGNCISHEAVPANILVKFGTEKQREFYFDRTLKGDLWGVCATEPQGGSDMGNIQTVAVKKGDKYVLNGRKAWAMNSDGATRCLIWASTDPSKKIRGLSLFIVESKLPGFKPQPRYHMTGWAGITALDLVLENVEVPAENLIGQEGDGFKCFLAGLNPGRLGIAAQGVGLMEGAYDYSRDYITKRIEFGQPVSEFQAMRFMLANMATEIETARCLTYTCAKLVDTGSPDADKLIAMAKAKVSDMAVQVTGDAVQVMGGQGVIKDNHPVEKFMRDAAGLRIADGANGIMRLIVADMLLPRAPKPAPKPEAK